MKALLCLALCLAALASGAASAQSAGKAATEAPRPGGFFDIFNPQTSPFIPIPEIGTDPNSGTTYGFLPVFLSTNAKSEITRIIAPDATYNSNLGFGGHFRIFAYPSRDRQWSVVAGVKQRIERELDAVYETGLTRQSRWSLRGRVVYDRSATERFFGFGNDTPKSAETNYTNEQEYVEARLGLNLSPALQIAYEARPRAIQIERGVLPNLPTIGDRFSGTPGLGGEHEFLNRLSVVYDTRDSTAIPTRGGEYVAYAGIADTAFLSSASYTVFGLDARQFIRLGERFILAAHAALRYMPGGGNPPFWAQSSLGGDRSVIGERQPLRGFGDGRFIDRNSFSSSVELRSRVYSLDLFSTRLSLELAPVIDAGRVFHELDDNPLRGLHLVEGLGFRAVASPFIVGYVDVGHGSEGIAVFSGIDYVF
jgi:hypothetical protein